MLALHVDLETRAVVDAFRALRHGLNSELEKALRATGQAVAAEARSSHSYIDRTGRLTASIRALPVTGSFTADTLTGGVTATTRYARYVEEGTPRARAYQYLSTAVFLQREDTARRVEDALEAAVRGAGF